MSTHRVPFENAPDMIRAGVYQFGASVDRDRVDIITYPGDEAEAWGRVSREDWEAIKAHVDSQLDDTRDDGRDVTR